MPPPGDVNTVTERIQFETKGLKEALRDVGLLQKILNALEGKPITVEGIDAGSLDEIRKLREELDKLKNQKKKGKGGILGDLMGEDGGGGLLNSMSMLGFKLQQLSYLFQKVVGIVDSVTGMFLDANLAALKLGTSVGQISKGFGIGDAGKEQVSKLRQELADITSSTAWKDLKGILPSPQKVAGVLGGVQKGGISAEVLRGTNRVGETLAHVSHNAMLLNGNLDDLGGTGELVGDLMSRFGKNLTGADRALKGIVVDSHASGMATDRFLGTVRNISAEMSTYGDYVDEVSSLLSRFGEKVGVAQAEKDFGTLLTTMRGMSDASKVFMINQLGAAEAAKIVRGESDDLNESMNEIQISLTAATAEMDRFKAGRINLSKAEQAALQERITALSRERDRLTTRKNLIEDVAGGLERKPSDPFSQIAAAGAMGPLGMMSMMSAGLKGLGAKGSFKGAMGNLDEIVPQITALTGKSVAEAIDLVRILQEMQGTADTLDDAIRSMSGRDREKFEAAISPAEQAKQAAEFYANFTTFSSKISNAVEGIVSNVKEGWFANIEGDLDSVSKSFSNVERILEGIYLGLRRIPAIGGYLPASPQEMAVENPMSMSEAEKRYLTPEALRMLGEAVRDGTREGARDGLDNNRKYNPQGRNANAERK